MKTTAEEKKAKEISRLEKEKAKSKWKGYMAYFFLLVTVIYIADELVSQIGTQMQSVIAAQVFAPIVGADFAVARMSAVGTVALVSTILALLYKPLSDRFGRKIFLVINTLGMGIGTIVVGLCTDIPTYIVGILITNFFIPHDMQAVYIQECAPAEHRGKMYSVVKCFATIGILLIPVLRQIFIPGTDLSNWRYVYLIPGIIAVVAAFVALIGIRESDAFIESRLRTLKMTEEEREAEKASKKETAEKSGIIQGVKHVFKHKQTRWLLIANSFVMLCVSVTMYYESIMNMGYAQQYVNAGMDLTAAKAEATALVTQALMLFSVGSAAAQLLPGFIADKFGRKKGVIVMSVILLVSFLGYYFGSRNNVNPYIVGALCGASVGAYWSLGDLLMLMASESVPTSIRASVTTASGILVLIPTILAMVVITVVSNILGDASIALAALVTTVPGLILAIVTLAFKVKETTGVDMSAITGNEFD